MGEHVDVVLELLDPLLDRVDDGERGDRGAATRSCGDTALDHRRGDERPRGIVDEIESQCCTTTAVPCSGGR